MAKIIKVCVISIGMPYEHGGAELRAFRHTQYLRSQDETNALMIAWDQQEGPNSGVTVPEFVYPITLHFQENIAGSWFKKLIAIGLHIGEILIRLWARLSSLRDQLDIVQIIFAASWFSLLAIPVAKAFHKPVILEMTDCGVDDPLTLNRRAGHPEKQIFPHKPLKYRLFLMADAYVSKSQALSDVYLQAGLPKNKLFQIASAVDTQRFCPPVNSDDKLAIRLRLGLDPQRPILLFVGRINYQKGLDWFLPAFSQVLLKHPNTQLLVVGPTISYDLDYAKKIEHDVLKMKLSDNIQFVGRVSNVDEYLKAADIFVLPTRHEGFAGAILEAMSAGLPIVTSDIPEISLSQITNNMEGLLIPVGDISRSFTTLCDLLSNSEMREQLGRAARQRVLREFTPDVIGSQYVNLYRQLMPNAK